MIGPRPAQRLLVDGGYGGGQRANCAISELEGLCPGGMGLGATKHLWGTEYGTHAHHVRGRLRVYGFCGTGAEVIRWRNGKECCL